MGAPAFKQVKQFDPDDDLARKLVAFEGNVAETFLAVGQVLAVKLKPTARQTIRYQAKVGDLVMVDTAAGDVSVTMPAPTPANAGQTIGFVKLSASNNINLSSADGRDTVNAGPTDIISGAIRFVTYISSGAGWYSA